MNRIVIAFRSFFALLFSGSLPGDVVAELGLAPEVAPKAPGPAAPAIRSSDGALQILGILQRDGRLLDFFMEDIAPYSDEQVGSAARGVHSQVREALGRYFEFAPVIDGVEGSFAQAPSKDPALVKFLGNVPATPPAGGILRHRGWKVSKSNFPSTPPAQDLKILAPAELEIE